MFTSSSFQFHTPILHHHHHHYHLIPSSRIHSPLTLTLHNPTSLSFIHPPPLHHLLPPATLSVAAKAPTADKSGEQKWIYEGIITESLPNGMFRVRLDNQDLILGYISGKIRKYYIRILPGDRVEVEVSRYDSSKGRIVRRQRNTGNTPPSS